MKQPHERLVEARELAGYDNATEAAEALGVRPPTYLGHENGSRGFKAKAERYARFFKVSYEWLMTGRGEARSKTLGAFVDTLPPDQQRKIREYIEFIESRASLKDVG